MLAAKLHSDNGLMAANSKATLTPIAAVAVDLECGYSEVTSPSRIGITAVGLAVLPADGRIMLRPKCDRSTPVTKRP